jgi:glycosyltransferase involved in cell wall biosynthesis
MRFTRNHHPPHIHFHGHCPRADVLQALSQASCLVHPTRADTSPNCVKEARVIGLPVVTTPCGGQTQYVEHGKSGIIHPAGDVGALIDGVLTITRDAQTSLRMGAHGQAACREKLHPSATAKRLLEIYHQ